LAGTIFKFFIYELFSVFSVKYIKSCFQPKIQRAQNPRSGDGSGGGISEAGPTGVVGHSQVFRPVPADTVRNPRDEHLPALLYSSLFCYPEKLRREQVIWGTPFSPGGGAVASNIVLGNYREKGEKYKRKTIKGKSNRKWK
jgi:hypothetical protein